MFLCATLKKIRLQTLILAISLWNIGSISLAHDRLRQPSDALAQDGPEGGASQELTEDEDDNDAELQQREDQLRALCQLFFVKAAQQRQQQQQQGAEVSRVDKRRLQDIELICRQFHPSLAALASPPVRRENV